MSERLPWIPPIEPGALLVPARSAAGPLSPRVVQMLSRSESLRLVIETIRRVADTDVDVLVHGETGTGKELVANALHQQSRRAVGPFVAVDCGAIPATLLESELMGFERGAFTGAAGRRIGLLESAHRGTFFLDEVGELPITLQAKLLRVLQERRIRRLGSERERAVDIRLVAATSRDLAKDVREGRFRQDLLYRINALEVQLPPLRERHGDVDLLAEAFRERFAREMGRPVGGFAPAALSALRAYAWPGNVRELQNVVRSSLALARGPVVELADLPPAIRNAATASRPVSFFDVRAGKIAQFEREFLVERLARHEGDVRAAAREARIPRGTFYRLMKRHDLRSTQFRGGAGPPPDATSSHVDEDVSG